MPNQDQIIPRANAYVMALLAAVAAGLVVYGWMAARTQMIVERAVGVATGSLLAQDQKRIMALEDEIDRLRGQVAACQRETTSGNAPQLAP